MESDWERCLVVISGLYTGTLLLQNNKIVIFTSTYLRTNFISTMQKSGSDLVCGFMMVVITSIKDRDIEILICGFFCFYYTFTLLLQAYLGFLVLEAEVITTDRKKWSYSGSETFLCFCTSLKPPVPRPTLEGKEAVTISSAGRGEKRLAPHWEELKSVGCSHGIDCSL